MSHITNVTMNFKDLDVMAEAGLKLGFRFMKDQTSYKWFGRFVNDSNRYGNRDPKTFGQCSHALRALDFKPGDYEIGVITEADGTFSLLYDAWGPGRLIEQKAGVDLVLLKQAYGETMAMRRAKTMLERHGFRLTDRQVLANKTVRLQLRTR